MNSKAFLDFHKAFCDAARSITERKNADYASPEKHGDEPLAWFHNFLQCERLAICPVEQGMLVRLSDKFARLCNLLAPGHEIAVKDETVEDTIQDMVNYLVLLAGYRIAKRERESHV